MSDTTRWTYINGDWKPDDHAMISIYDSQFMFGDAVFEMHRTFGHKHFLLDEHIDRLWRSMKYMQIPITKSKDDVRRICDEAIERNCFPKDEEYRFMINVSRGPLGIYRDVFELKQGDKWNEPTWIVNVWPLSKTTKTLAKFYRRPADARVTRQRQIPSQYLEAKVKNRSRAHYMLANLEMSSYGDNAVPLLLDDMGFVCESTGANFIIVKDNALVIPERRNMLRGCSMQFICDVLAPSLNIPVIEKNIELYDAMDADEAMFTGTFNNVIPCDSVNGCKLRYAREDDGIHDNGFGHIGSLIVFAWNKHIRDHFEGVGDDFCFIKQILGWADEDVTEDDAR